MRERPRRRDRNMEKERGRNRGRERLNNFFRVRRIERQRYDRKTGEGNSLGKEGKEKVRHIQAGREAKPEKRRQKKTE